MREVPHLGPNPKTVQGLKWRFGPSARIQRLATSELKEPPKSGRVREGRSRSQETTGPSRPNQQDGLKALRVQYLDAILTTTLQGRLVLS